MDKSVRSDSSASPAGGDQQRPYLGTWRCKTFGEGTLHISLSIAWLEVDGTRQQVMNVHDTSRRGPACEPLGCRLVGRSGSAWQCRMMADDDGVLLISAASGGSEHVFRRVHDL
jgi:hypothetical protein